VKLVYLSAPYTTGPELPEKRQVDIDKAAAWLIGNWGVFVFSPITYEKPLKAVYGENMSWEFWAPLDAEMVSRCDELWVLCLNNWQNSRGVNFEIDEARKLGKPVVFIREDTMPVKCPRCGGTGQVGLEWTNEMVTNCSECEDGWKMEVVGYSIISEVVA
jgi:hypothetical protein